MINLKVFEAIVYFFPLYTSPLCNSVYNGEQISTEMENIYCPAKKNKTKSKFLMLFVCSFF